MTDWLTDSLCDWLTIISNIHSGIEQCAHSKAIPDLLGKNYFFKKLSKNFIFGSQCPIVFMNTFREVKYTLSKEADKIARKVGLNSLSALAAVMKHLDINLYSLPVFFMKINAIAGAF